MDKCAEQGIDSEELVKVAIGRLGLLGLTGAGLGLGGLAYLGGKGKPSPIQRHSQHFNPFGAIDKLYKDDPKSDFHAMMRNPFGRAYDNIVHTGQDVGHGIRRLFGGGAPSYSDAARQHAQRNNMNFIPMNQTIRFPTAEAKQRFLDRGTPVK
jgi:hypothetical protein